MSSSVLFDTPGPRTRARHRLYGVIGAVVLLALLGLIVWRMWETGQFAYELWEPFVTPAYIQVLLVDGLLKTLQMAFLSIIFAVVFGLVFGAGKLSDHSFVRWPCWLVVEFFRAVPLLLLIIFIFYAFGVGDGFGAYWSVVFGLTLYNGSVLAEVFRAGIQAVPHGQGEAAYAIGMRKTQVMTIVLLPQGVKIMLPAIISQCVVALKDTSLGYYITAPGLTFVGKQIYTEFGNQLQTVLVVASLYIASNLVLTWVATWVQHRLVGEKKQLEVSVVGAPSTGGEA
ncbi:amino acid ABC transporter permease [Nocardioides iriomotensis]|uniref:Amino acid ABC transporter permease n=1 Tax=Nocardioides iriomotensis TaxID=715784 RepID=A0A4Q5J262_9ACTN|nr:amino acid ABC transporter permease [Nocardioides iriomotensis]RYU12473.1 amino acid ABC transporter permease [Nocardioides iriomotensis]